MKVQRAKIAREAKRKAGSILRVLGLLYVVMAIGWALVGGVEHVAPNEMMSIKIHVSKQAHYLLPSPSYHGWYWVPPVFERTKTRFRYDIPDVDMYMAIATYADKMYKKATRVPVERDRLIEMVHLAEKYLNKHYPETLSRPCKISDVKIYRPKSKFGRHGGEMAYYTIKDRTIHINETLSLNTNKPILGTIVHEVGHDGLAPGNEPYNQLLSLEVLAEMRKDGVRGADEAFWYELRSHAIGAMRFHAEWYWGATLLTVSNVLWAGGEAYYGNPPEKETTEPMYIGFRPWVKETQYVVVQSLPKTIYSALTTGQIFSTETEFLKEHLTWKALVAITDERLKLMARGIHIKPYELVKHLLGEDVAIALARHHLYSTQDEWVLLRGQLDDVEAWMRMHYDAEEKKRREEWREWRETHVVRRQGGSILYWYGPLEAALHATGLDRDVSSVLLNIACYSDSLKSANSFMELMMAYYGCAKLSKLPLDDLKPILRPFLNIRDDWPYDKPVRAPDGCAIRTGGVMVTERAWPEDVIMQQQ